MITAPNVSLRYCPKSSSVYPIITSLISGIQTARFCSGSVFPNCMGVFGVNTEWNKSIKAMPEFCIFNTFWAKLNWVEFNHVTMNISLLRTMFQKVYLCGTYYFPLAGQRPYGMRSLPKACTHGQHWESNPRSDDSESECLCPLGHMFCVLM